MDIKPIDSLSTAIAKANLVVFRLDEPIGKGEDTVLLGPGIKLDFTGTSPSFNVDREVGDIVGIWALVEEAG